MTDCKSKLSCVETGTFTAVKQSILPRPPAKKPNAFRLRFKDVDPVRDRAIRNQGVMVFHTVGCSGAPECQQGQLHVAEAMATQLSQDESPSTDDPAFFYQLGDVAYKDEPGNDEQGKDNEDEPGKDEDVLWNNQFYKPYRQELYPRYIFSIAGNHDGKRSKQKQHSELPHYVENFCTKKPRQPQDNKIDNRQTMTQPYIYWRIDTPLAYFIGLYTNVVNGGMLDAPSKSGASSGRQFKWFVRQLEHVRKKNSASTRPKALIVTMHYPPYSGATNFAQRGDPTLGPTKGANHAQPLGNLLQSAFRKAKQRPDMVLCAHAHLYQRLTYTYHDGWEVPYLIAGCGGHHPLEEMWTRCDGKTDGEPKEVPFPAVIPNRLEIPHKDRVTVEQFNDKEYGFLKIKVTADQIDGTLYTTTNGTPHAFDCFQLDRRTHSMCD